MGIVDVNKSMESLCELCCSKSAVFECATCGTARLEKSGSLLLCAECSNHMHRVGAFQSHNVVEICEKLWGPVKEKLRELAKNEDVAAIKKERLQSAVQSINKKYDEAVNEVKKLMNNLRAAIDDREQSLIEGLTTYKTRLDSICQVAGGHLTTFMERTDKLKCEAEDLKGLRDPTAIEGLLDELTLMSSRSTTNIQIPAKGDMDFEFCLKKRVSHLLKGLGELVLPVLREDEGTDTIKARVTTGLTARGKFTAVKPWETTLRMISDSIRADIESRLIVPKIDARVGDMCSVEYSGDGEWHRARVVETVSKLEVKIYFVDYGEFQICTRVELMSLPGKYLMYPFKAISCSLTDEGVDDVEFSREARWMFSDAVYMKDVTLEVNSVKGIDGDVHIRVVQIKEPKSGTCITAKILEEGNEKPNDPSAIKYRDIRLKNPISDTGSAAAVIKPSGVKPSPKPSGVKPVTSRGEVVHQLSRVKQSGVKPVTSRGEVVHYTDTSCASGRLQRNDEFQMLFVKGLPPELSMDDVRELFSQHGEVKKIIFDISLPGRAWIVMDIHGALNAILKMRGYKICGGDPRGLLIDKTDDYYSDPADRRKKRV